MAKGRLTLKIVAILVFVDILETFTHFCFKKSAIPESGFEITGLSTLLVFIQSVSSSGFLWLGLLSVILTFIIWSMVLSKIDLSVAVPICSFSYILVPLVSIIFFNEKVCALRWLGIFFILLGVIFVSRSAKKEGTLL